MSARDFIYVSLQGYDGRTFVMGGCSVEYKDDPSTGNIVRALNGPGCQMVSPTSDKNKSQLVWLMDCDYKVTMGDTILWYLTCLSCRAGYPRVSWTRPCPSLRLPSWKASGSWLPSSGMRGSFKPSRSFWIQ